LRPFAQDFPLWNFFSSPRGRVQGTFRISAVFSPLAGTRLPIFEQPFDRDGKTDGTSQRNEEKEINLSQSGNVSLEPEAVMQVREEDN
jgi:hypothetical protein